MVVRMVEKAGGKGEESKGRIARWEEGEIKMKKNDKEREEEGKRLKWRRVKDRGEEREN